MNDNVTLPREVLERTLSALEYTTGALGVASNMEIGRRAIEALRAALAAPQSADGWIACSERMPDEDEPVWLCEGEHVWIGTRAYDDGWCFTKCYAVPYWTGLVWEDPDAEWDDDYRPTHWRPLPTPPSVAHRPAEQHHAADQRGDDERDARGLLAQPEHRQQQPRAQVEGERADDGDADDVRHAGIAAPAARAVKVGDVDVSDGGDPE